MKKLLFLFATLLMAGGMIQAQDIIVKNNGSVINAYRTDYSGQLIYYQTSDSDTAAIFRIRKEDVLVIRLADGTAITPNAAPSVQDKGQSAENDAPLVGESRFPDIDLTNYHGFLLNKGNCVYVTYNTKTDYETAAVEAMKKMIAENGLWQVVDKPSQAHFVLQYNVCLSGMDFVYLIFRPRDNYEQTSYIDYCKGIDPKVVHCLTCGGQYTNEDVANNANIAQSLIGQVLQDYKPVLESEEFLESVKSGKLVKPKDKNEKWHLIRWMGGARQSVNPSYIQQFHNYFYR